MAPPSANAPPHLTVRILYSDDDIVVIDKPCDLRSVPGHADMPPSQEKRLSPDAGVNEDGGDGGINSHSNRRTTQEAWVKAIQLMGVGGETNRNGVQKIPIEEAAVIELLQKLGTTANPCCVPRKLETFVKYCHRNSNRLLPEFQKRALDTGVITPQTHATQPSNKNGQYEPTQKKQKRDKLSQQNNILPIVRSIAQISYAKIKQKQRPLINSPTPTKDSESAVGQLHLLGFGHHDPCVSTTTKERLHVVHRLDCQTSGIMVVARNQASASFLCRVWRERESIKKVYLAHVRHWPPYHEHRQTEGNIDIPLAPSRTERIKWEVLPVAEGGKECKTFWKVYEDMDKSSSSNEEGATENTPTVAKGITLELHPITGRTHQLRLHCAAIGSGIVGDSLYGDSPIAWLGDHSTKNHDQEIDVISTLGNDISKTLRLHAHKLLIPHPSNPDNGEKLEFESAKPW